ncbi:MAG TPA: hypothetical protein VGL97_17485 [Bryobacteraceae bacterium]|jgi:hypothetical protein
MKTRVAPSSGALKNGYEVAIYFNRYRPLKHADGNDEAPIGFLFDENAFEIFQRTVRDSHTLALLKKWTGLGAYARFQNRLDCFDLVVWNRRGMIPEPHDRNDTRSRDYGQRPAGVESAKDVSRKKWDLGRNHTI